MKLTDLAGSIPVFLSILAGEMVCAFSAAAGITPHIVLSRVSGPAPLSVFVDATTTGGLAGGDYINAYFGWNFDRDNLDPDGKHTLTRGFVAAHVYEVPGTYTIALSIIDRTGVTATATVQVVVSEFSGATYYVASNGSNSAAGTSMNTPLATPDYAIKNKAAPNTRILLRRGDSFSVAGEDPSNNQGPVLVAAYTDPDRPSTDAPVIVGTSGTVLPTVISDWRFVDLHLRAGSVVLINNARDVLLLRLEFEGMTGNANNVYTSESVVGTYLFDCLFHDYSAYAYYCQGVNQTAVVGNRSDRLSGGQHWFRCQGGAKAFIAYNDLKESGVNYDNITVRGTTSQVYLLGNRLDHELSIHPMNNTAVEYQSYCAADGNILTDGSIHVHAKHVAVRNNLISEGLISLESGGVVPISDSVTVLGNSCYGGADNLVSGSAANVIVKNNVLFSTTTNNWAAGFSSAGLTGYAIDNNLYYAPARTGGGLSFDGSGFSGWQTSGNDVHGDCGVNPLFAVIDSSSADFLKLGNGSPAIGTGAAPGDAAPNFCDFNGNLRPAGQSTDIGARLYAANAVRKPPPGHAAGRRVRALDNATFYDLTGRQYHAAALRGAPRTNGVIIIVDKRGKGGSSVLHRAIVSSVSVR